MHFKVLNSTGEFLDFRIALKISAFLFAALIFFVSFFYQEKKENDLFNHRENSFKNLLNMKWLHAGD